MADIFKLSALSIATNAQTRYNDMLAGNPYFQPSSYESIATVTVGAGGSSSITFSSIPSTYKHLQIRYIARNTSTNTGLNLNFNGDTTSTAYWHLLYGSGTAAAAYTISTAYIQGGGITTSNQTASIYGAGVIDILDYSSTVKNKTVRSLNGWDNNGSGFVYFHSGAWYNTNAITSLTLVTGDAANLAQYSSFALYGVKG